MTGAGCDLVVAAGAAVALHGLIWLHPANLEIPERSVPDHRLLPRLTGECPDQERDRDHDAAGDQHVVERLGFETAVRVEAHGLSIAEDRRAAPPRSQHPPTLAFVMRRLGTMLLSAAVLLVAPGLAAAEPAPPTDPPPSGRVPLVEVPEGCQIQPLPDVVFVGTVVASDYRTSRFRIDQSRAGDLAQFAAGELVDVRYGIDTKYLREGSQYLIAAVYDPNISALRSRVKPEALIYGGDEIIGATESELECPEIVDPMRTMHVDGSSVDSGLLRPLVNDRDGLFRVLLVPIVLAIGAVFALAAFRWLLTGFGRGVESLTTSNQASREPRRRPVPANAGGPGGGRPQMTQSQRAVQRVQQRSLPPGEQAGQARQPGRRPPGPGTKPPPRGRRRR